MHPFWNRSSLIWAILVLASLVSWESRFIVGDGASFVRSGILLIAFFKVRVVGQEFMDLRHAPALLRNGFDAWALALCATLVVLLW
jgi:hypothetical protein